MRRTVLRRREFVARCAAGSAALMLPLGCFRSPGEDPSSRPNLLLLMTDDQAWDAIGYASGGRVKTPNLDRLAAGGMTFTAAHCNTLPCIASRASLMSGLQHHRWERASRQVRGSSEVLEIALAPGTWTWTHALRAAGYTTALFGKMHFFPRNSQHGFDIMQLCDPWPRRRDDYEQWLEREGQLDEWQKTRWMANSGLPTAWRLDPRYHRISWVRDRAIDFLASRRPGDPPHAAIVSFFAPHGPYDPAEPFASEYDPATLETPTDQWTDMENMPPQLRDLPRHWERDRFAGRGAGFARFLAAYLGLVSEIDDAIGAITPHVDLERTLVLFTTDHGNYVGKRGQLFKMPTIPFEAIARVPFFACGVGVPGGTTYSHPVSLVDIAPTFLRAAGLPVPGDLDGVALQECFADPSSGEDRSAYCFGADGFDALEQHGVKYFRSHDRAAELLFDLATDPDELHNLAGEPGRAAQVQALRAAMDAIQTRPAPHLARFATFPVASPGRYPRRTADPQRPGGGHAEE